ncbi:hypothetical protein [Caballeronia mineralivorans]|jgi:hypothetical protein|uniref:hypothetical protein n=1 Tax=Caballeronia mineralivorans TaxID=2010198 RepID=UPI0023F2DD4B|nr:hypothetical protein [Caballeronia mineralivorans]MEA3098271.1 hypothetical protein [Caballeronia mineralivorans]
MASSKAFNAEYAREFGVAGSTLIQYLAQAWQIDLRQILPKLRARELNPFINMEFQ